MVRYQQRAVSGGVGVNERQIHPGSGLRIASASVALAAGGGNFTPGAFISTSDADVALASAGSFASLRTRAEAAGNRWDGGLPYPMTPVISWMIIPATATMTIQFRVTGYDQFGARIVETTPIMTIANLDTATFTDGAGSIWLSKVFSYVDNIEFRGSGFSTGAATPKFVTGWYALFDPNGNGAGASTGGWENAAGIDWFGAGVPMRMNFFGTERNAGFGTPLQVMPQVTDPIASVFATSTLTSSGTRVAGETVTIGDVVYTFRASLNNAIMGEVLIGGSEAATLQNLYDAINRSGVAGTQYSLLGQPHPTVRASAVTATTVVVTARTAGSTGNFVSVAETGANLAWGGALLTGGVDSGLSQHPEILGFAAVLLRQKTTPTVINAAGRFKPFGQSGVGTGVVLGQSAAPTPAAGTVSVNGTVTYTYGPWEGTPHKIGFRSSDFFQSSPVELNGSSQRANNIPLAGAQAQEDDLLFTFTIRSRLGTAQDSTSKRTRYLG